MISCKYRQVPGESRRKQLIISIWYTLLLQLAAGYTTLTNAVPVPSVLLLLLLQQTRVPTLVGLQCITSRFHLHPGYERHNLHTRCIARSSHRWHWGVQHIRLTQHMTARAQPLACKPINRLLWIYTYQRFDVLCESVIAT